jgi:putative phage-type endonuclease
MTIIDVVQRSPEWFAARAGSLGASQLADVIAKTRSGYSTSRQNLMGDLAAERLTGVPTNSYSNAAMQWGVDNEAEARAAYVFEKDVAVEEVGMILHPKIPGTHASPDGVVFDTSVTTVGDRHGLVEIKCPFVTAQHLATLVGREIKAEYMTQMQWQLACSGAAWVDYVSYDPRLPAELQLFVRRIPRDADVIEVLETEVRAFLSDLDDLLGELKRRFGVEVRS